MSQEGTLRTRRILMQILWLTKLKALDQSARRVSTALGGLHLSVFFNMKSIREIRAWEQEWPGRAYWSGEKHFLT